MHQTTLGRLVLIDPDRASRELLTTRLTSLGFIVEAAADAAAGAELALAAPPAAVIADLWMGGISGVQLCRLLRAEPATAEVPIVLRALHEDPRSRFWAEQAGAAALVSKGRMGDLARVLRDVTEKGPVEEPFFMHLGAGSLDIRDRIAQHLDAALFESVIAAEVRALGNACTFDQLFDSFSQLVARLMSYSWLAITTKAPNRMAVHAHPRSSDRACAEVRAALEVPADLPALVITDEDALESVETPRVHVRDVTFGGVVIGKIAIAAPDVPVEHGIPDLVALLGREIGGAIRMTTLVEQAQRLATIDSLTGLRNRRAFLEAVRVESSRADRCSADMSLLLLDVDHFKSINDRFGHGVGDAVLARIGQVLPRCVRAHDIVARWGGEEFVVLLPETPLEGAIAVAERIRGAFEAAKVSVPEGELSFTASVGVTVRTIGDTEETFIERSDRAMYRAKSSGRNRVCVEQDIPAAIARPPASIIGPASRRSLIPTRSDVVADSSRTFSPRESLRVKHALPLR